MMLNRVVFLVLLAAAVNGATALAQRDRLDTEATGWLWLAGQTGTEVLARISQGWRLIDVEFRDNNSNPSSPVYDVLFVANQPAQTSSFLVTAIAADIISFGTNNNLRPTDIEVYLVPGTSSFLYAAVYEPDFGTNWAVLFGLSTAQQVLDYASNNNARPIDLEVTDPPFAAVHGLFYENIGDDARGYAIFLGVTAQQWTDAAINNSLRPVDIDKRGPDLFDIVYVNWTETWTWWNSTASGVILNGLADLNMRPIDVEWDPVTGGWTVIGLQNWLFKSGFESGNTNAWSGTVP